MKKILRTLVVALLVFSMTLSLAGCISSKWTKVEENLKNEGYIVTVYNTDVEKVAAVTLWNTLGGKFNAQELDKVKCLLKGERDGKVIYIAFCDDLETASIFEEKFDDFLDELDDKGILDDDYYDTDQNFKVAYLGHEDAIRAAR